MDKELNILLHFENLSNSTKQINNYINYVLKQIYNKYFNKKYKSFQEFKKLIILNDRPLFIDK